MKLSQLQARLLNEMVTDAETDLTEIARRLRVTPKAVRYHRELLVRHGIVTEQAFFDVYPLGYRYMNVYFSVTPCPKERLRDLVRYFVEHPRVSWMGELGGDFHFGVAFLVRDQNELQDELNHLPSEFRQLIEKKSVITHQSLTLYQLKILGGASGQSFLGYGSTETVDTLDSIDRHLLRLLASEPKLSVREIARRLGRTPSVVSDRTSRLRQYGILQGKWLRASFEALGLMSYKLLVFTHGISDETRQKFRDFCRTHRCVDHLIECIADWEFEVGIVVSSYSQVMEALSDCGAILGSSARSLKVVPLLSVLKLDQLPPAFLAEAPVSMVRRSR